MRGKKLSNQTPMGGVMDFLSTLPSALSSVNRGNALTTEIGNITIDTCLATDTHLWETGIQRLDIEGVWVIVDQYKNKKEATTRHQKWVEAITKDPTMKLKDINLWDLPELNQKEE